MRGGADEGQPFLRSALATDGLHSWDEVVAWFAGRARRGGLTVRRIGLDELDAWGFDGAPRRLAHRSGGFFSVEGLRTTTSWGERGSWDQPILHQPEVGILGLLARSFGGVRHFLMQAKMEPGNINVAQLSPTVQATRSNYTRVHRGRAPPFVEYFLAPGRGRRLVDTLQSEQGAYFLRKRNRNMVVETDEEIEVPPDFCWLTLGQIKRLTRVDDCVNMDTRSVLACIPLVERWRDPDAEVLARCPDGSFGVEVLRSWADDAAAICPLPEVLRWWTDLEASHRRTTAQIPIDEMRGWENADGEIRPVGRRSLAVIAVAVAASEREVPGWTQPMLARPGLGLSGLVLQRIGGVLHALVRACFEPGSRNLFELGPTVSIAQLEDATEAPLLAVLRARPPAQVRHDAILSEEGGRFFQLRSRSLIVELPVGEVLDVPSTHRWLTLGQIHALCVHGYFNIEARSLFACIQPLTEPTA